MLGILVELALSWLILFLIEKKNLTVLGLIPTSRRLKGFIVLFLIAAACCLMEVFLRIQFFREQYQINPLLNLRLIWKGFWWNLVSVIYEELIFRGALLYILVRRWGVRPAIIFSSIAFGIYHWFSFNLFGNIPAMIYVFIITGIMGFILAYSYVKTGSLYMAIGFHLGWNLMHGFVFSKGPVGNGVFVLSPNQPAVNVSHFTYYAVTLLPYLILFTSGCLVIRKWKDLHQQL
jgi:uncharacterized protein